MSKLLRAYLANWLIGASAVVATTMLALKLPKLWSSYQLALNFVHGKTYVFLWHWTHANNLHFPIWMSKHYITIEFLLDGAGLILMIPLGIAIRRILRSQAIGIAQDAIKQIPLLGKAVSVGLDVVQILINTVDRLKEDEAGIPVLIWSGSGTDEVGLLQDWGSPIEVVYASQDRKKSQSANIWVSGTWKVVDINRIIPLNQILYRSDETAEFTPFKVDFSNLVLRHRLKGSSKDESMDLAIEVARAVAAHLESKPNSPDLPKIWGTFNGQNVQLTVSREFLIKRNHTSLIATP